VDFIQREAAHAFINRVRDWEVKQHLLMDGDRLLKEALNQAKELEAAAGTPARLTMRQVTIVPVPSQTLQG
jgi:hypothetical protein